MNWLPIQRIDAILLVASCDEIRKSFLHDLPAGSLADFSGSCKLRYSFTCPILVFDGDFPLGDLM